MAVQNSSSGIYLMEKISWTYHVRKEVVLLRVKEQRDILNEIRKRKVNWIGHILRRNCLLTYLQHGAESFLRN